MMTIISIFCKVIDNFGDIGVCWRLARNFCNYLDKNNKDNQSTSKLHDHKNYQINLYLDNIQALSKITLNSYMDVKNINVIEWNKKNNDDIPYDNSNYVINAFACKLPQTYQNTMPSDIVWVQLDYLATEEWADEYHGLNAFINNHKRIFFTQGFTHKTAGLITQDFEKIELISENINNLYAKYGIKNDTNNNSIKIFIFSYINSQFIQGIDTLNKLASNMSININLYMPTSVFTSFQDYINKYNITAFKHINIHSLEFCPQHKFDELLQLFDIVWVRGEDSFVRAQLSQIPMIWQAYIQENNAHLDKVNGFFSNYLPFFTHTHQQIIKNMWYASNCHIDFTSQIWHEFIHMINDKEYLHSLAKWHEYICNLPNLIHEIIQLK
ncbi:MAG: hypothetical protein RLZZ210_236 [Pseudomonadota bacterium]|jgi:uncharacterized repeat protein (TIGR03837 family)